MVKKKSKWRIVIVMAIIVALLMIAPTVWVQLKGRPHIVAAADAPKAPVALVLGTGLNPDGTPSPRLAARLEVALGLWQHGKVGAILVSGDNQRPEYDEPTAMKTYLVAHGVPNEVVVTDPAGLDTHASCVRAVKVYGVKEAILVSQSYHLPRAITLCSAVGMKVTGVGDDTARQNWKRWLWGEVREVGANLKVLWDLASRHGDDAGPPSDAVKRALAASAWRG